MELSTRAAQIWPVLVLAARNRQILTYEILGSLIGVPNVALGRMLEPIQSYCLLEKLPPLTILVVSKSTGLPGVGFTAAADIPRYQAAVFEFDWLACQAPTPEALEAAVKAQPSRGVSAPQISSSETEPHPLQDSRLGESDSKGSGDI